MAFQSAFRERLRDMDTTRNHRLSLLQAEKHLQTNKSRLLSSKLTQIRSLEQRCLLLDRNLASKNFEISSLKSEIEFLDRKYQRFAQELRDLRAEIEEFEQLKEERDKCYNVKCCEMKEFEEEADKFSARIRDRIEELKCRRDEIKSRYMEYRKQNPEVQAAEMRKSELLAMKETMASTLESNKRVKSELEKQLQSLG